MQYFIEHQLLESSKYHGKMMYQGKKTETAATGEIQYVES